MKDLRKFIKTTLREYLNENINNISYSIEHQYGGNIFVNATVDGTTVGTLEIIDDSHWLSPEDEPTFTIVSVFVNEKYRKMGIYINLIKYFLKNNKYGVKELSSEKNPEFDTEPRSLDADNFWKHVFTNQKKYGIYVKKYEDDYEISLK